MHILKNAHAWAVVSFFFGGIFAADLRHLIRASLFGGRNRFVKFRYDNTLAKLRLLERVHQNVYELLRYLGEQSIWLGLTVFLFLGQTYMTTVPSVARFFPVKHTVVQSTLPQKDAPAVKTDEDSTAFLVAFGMYCYLWLSIGRLLAVFAFIRELREFASVKTRLHRRLQLLQYRLLIAQRPPHEEAMRMV